MRDCHNFHVEQLKSACRILIVSTKTNLLSVSVSVSVSVLVLVLVPVAVVRARVPVCPCARVPVCPCPCLGVSGSVSVCLGLQVSVGGLNVCSNLMYNSWTTIFKILQKFFQHVCNTCVFI